MRHISDDERRARLGVRHLLGASARSNDVVANDVVAISERLVGLHGSDPASVFLSARARMRTPAGAVAALEDALYHTRTLVRTLCMRRTMFVVPLDLVPIVQAACTDALVPGERRRLAQLIEQQGIARDGARWLRKVEAATMAELDARGEATGAELAKAVPGLARKITYGEGKTWAGTMGMSTRVLFLLSTAQLAVRGRPKGAWTSSQYRWAPMRTWLVDGIPTVAADLARADLVRRWLATYGPATTTDVKWWTGWSLAHTRAALADAGAVEVELDTGAGWVGAGDERVVRAPRPWVALLPALDPATMGWKERDWYLGPHGPALFDRNGNAGPTVWADGRIVGAWAQRASGDVVYELLEPVNRSTRTAIAHAADELRGWLGEVRVLPRFPTPLPRALAAGT